MLKLPILIIPPSLRQLLLILPLLLLILPLLLLTLLLLRLLLLLPLQTLPLPQLLLLLLLPMHDRLCFLLSSCVAFAKKDSVVLTIITSTAELVCTVIAVSTRTFSSCAINTTTITATTVLPTQIPISGTSLTDDASPFGPKPKEIVVHRHPKLQQQQQQRQKQLEL